jgi:transposase
MYAVDAEDGSPITYTEYEGNMVDSKAFMKLIELLIILRN